MNSVLLYSKHEYRRPEKCVKALCPVNGKFLWAQN